MKPESKISNSSLNSGIKKSFFEKWLLKDGRDSQMEIKTNDFNQI